MTAGAPILVDLRGTIPPDVLLGQPPHVDAAKVSHDIKGAIPYTGHNRAKCPAKGYSASLVGAGGWVAYVFEDRANRALDGYQAGRSDGAFAVADVRAQGYPAGCVIFTTADFPAHWSQISEYVRGFSEVVKAAGYVCGLYADGECIRGAKAAGLIVVGWLTCSGGFPGSGDHTGVDIRQRCAGEGDQIAIAGYGIDTNYVDTPFIAAWGQTVNPQPPTYVPAPFPGRFITPGEESNDVRIWTFILVGLGYHGFLSRGRAAAMYGIGKQRATKRFQRRHGLHADGIIGPLTWAAADKQLIELHDSRK